MKTFMKFTLAVFVMLLAGAAGQTRAQRQAQQQAQFNSDHPYLQMPFKDFNKGCRSSRTSGGHNYYKPNEIRALAKSDDLHVNLWGGGMGLSDIINSGCAWCASQPSSCKDFNKELDVYIRFKVGQYSKEYGRIVLEKKTSEGKLIQAENVFCKFSDSRCRKMEGTDYGYEWLTVNGWGVPSAWRGLALKNGKTFLDGKEEFSTLEAATDCYNRGCDRIGYKGQVVQHNLNSNNRQVHGAHGGSYPEYSKMTVQELQDLYWFGALTEEQREQVLSAIDEKSSTGGQETVEKCGPQGCRKTIDAKGPAPVNQSKGFDGYQTALIVGLSVLSSFITAGSIYACRRLGEKSIELPGDVEGQNVSL